MIRRLLDSAAFYYLAALVLLLAVFFTQFEIEIPKRSQGTVLDIRKLASREDLNLIFVVIDTLRSDRLGAYGYARNTSPTLDRMAASGIRFENVESQSSWTKASMASMWTGMYPRSTRIDHFSDGIPEEAVLPAEILRDEGFATAGLYRNGWVSPNFGFSQGFDLYVSPKPRRRAAQIEAESNLNRQIRGNDLDATESAVEFMRNHQHDRFMLYLHLMDVHQYLYDAESSLFGTSYSDIYDNAIHWVDRNVESLLGEMEELGMADRTIVVVASDHGEAFREHGVEGHAKDLYREVQSVPLIIALPFWLDPGIEVETRVANVDIWPTILDLMGLPSLPGAEGQSLLPLIEAAAAGDESQAGELATRPVYSQLNKRWGQPLEEGALDLVAVVDEPYRFIRMEPSGMKALFNHESDAGERVNVAPTEAAKVEEMEQLLANFLAEAATPWENMPTVEIDAMRLGQLRALGYSLPQVRDPKRKGEREALEREAAAETAAPDDH